MDDFIIASLASMTVIYLLFHIKIYIDIAYKRFGQDDRATVQIYALNRLIHYEMKLEVIDIAKRQQLVWPEVEIETKGGEIETKASREQRFIKKIVHILFKRPEKIKCLVRVFKHYLKSYRHFIDNVLSFLYCEQLNWKTNVGCDDAAVAGLTSGSVWLAKGVVVSSAMRRLRFTTKPTIKVVPVFNRSCFDTEFKCILTISLGNVINATLKTIQFIRKGATGDV